MLELAHVEALGRVFAQRGYAKHLQRCREFYRALRAGDVSGCAWPESHVRGLLAVLQLPPCESTLLVQPRNSHCHQCGQRAAFTVLSWDDRTWCECNLCHAQWLELQPTASSG